MYLSLTAISQENVFTIREEENYSIMIYKHLTTNSCYMLLVFNNVLKYTLCDNLYPFCQTIDHISFLSRYQPYHFCHTINLYIFSVNLSTISSQLLQQKMFCRSRWTITVQSIIVYLVNYPLLKDTFVVSFQFHHFTCSF